MNSNPPVQTLKSLVTQCELEFRMRFGQSASVVVAAPGRVNLIGGHVDYNDGFVMPFAIDRYLVIAAAPKPGRDTIRIQSVDLDDSVVIEVCQPLVPGRKGWVGYVEGVISGFQKLNVEIRGFDATVVSSVPLGSGLSSSAALEVAVATLMEQLTGKTLGLLEKAKLCQEAEHRYAGVPCGIMDPLCSAAGVADELMFIDCQTQAWTRVPFNDPAVSILVVNSKVQHALASSEYGLRRQQCRSALTQLGSADWRDVSMVEHARQSTVLSETEFRIARHVISEIKRTMDAVDAVRNRDWNAVGRLMVASHESLRDDYRVSCDELDLLVELAMVIGVRGGVYGSRMTGGGFGGCTVTLVETAKRESVKNVLANRYEMKTGIKPECFSCRPSRGAHVVRSEL